MRRAERLTPDRPSFGVLPTATMRPIAQFWTRNPSEKRTHSRSALAPIQGPR
jgi:hypothetical protein